MRKETQNGRGRYAMTAKELSYIAVAVALLAVCSWISIPIGDVPVTLQTFALFLIVGVLGTRRAILALLALVQFGIRDTHKRLVSKGVKDILDIIMPFH